jgi:hypothetical protein
VVLLHIYGVTRKKLCLPASGCAVTFGANSGAVCRRVGLINWELAP